MLVFILNIYLFLCVVKRYEKLSKKIAKYTLYYTEITCWENIFQEMDYQLKNIDYMLN